MKIFDIKTEILNNASLEKIQYELLKEANKAVKAAADAAYNVIAQTAKNELDTNRAQQYLNSLKFETVEDGYQIRLEGKSSWIEKGLDPGPMLPELATGPHSKTAKDGHRYAVIPLKQPGPGTRKGSLRTLEMSKAVSQALKQAKATKIVRDEIGWPKLGTVRTLRNVQAGPISKRGTRLLEGLQISQQKKGMSGKNVTRSFETFRVASTKQDRAQYWFRSKHIKGLEAFEKAGKFLESRLSSIVQDLFK